jgi:hypothetical protein
MVLTAAVSGVLCLLSGTVPFAMARRRRRS